MREQIIQVRVNEATQFMMNDARANADEELRQKADRYQGHFKKYQDTIAKYAQENKTLNQLLDTAVSREAFEESTSTVLAQKLEIEELRKKLKKKREKQEEKLSEEQEKEDEKKKAEKKAKKKKKKELQELMDSLNISDSSDDESSSSEED